MAALRADIESPPVCACDIESSAIEQEIEALDESLLSDDSGDEFDSMVN